jgi:hypothetical protein
VATLNMLTQWLPLLIGIGCLPTDHKITLQAAATDLSVTTDGARIADLASSPTIDASVAHPAGQVAGMIAVGYGALRVISRDDGQSWSNPTFAEINGGDDDQLLRAATWGNGLWIASGWRLLTSLDGVQWTDQGLIQQTGIMPCAVVEGLAFSDGFFYAACDAYRADGTTIGTAFQSADGLHWTKWSEIGNTTGHLHLGYRGNKFVAAGDTHTSFESTDAQTWTVMPNVLDATFCDGDWRNPADCGGGNYWTSQGSWIASKWQAQITRSTDGTNFTVVYTDSQMNTMCTSQSIAEGYVAP